MLWTKYGTESEISLNLGKLFAKKGKSFVETEKSFLTFKI